MNRLRKLTKGADVTKGDIEAPEGTEASDEGPVPAPRGGGNNPVFVAKAIVRKVLDLLLTDTDDDNTDIRTVGGIVNLLKDTIAGLTLGVLSISLVIMMDHSNIIHFQGAHHFRDSAFQALSDPETMANIEESAEIKFMTVDEYEKTRQEIDGVEEQVSAEDEELEEKTREEEEKQREVVSLQDEYDRLLALLALDKYCGGCTWAGKVTCDQRVSFLKDSYKMGPIDAKLNAMSLADGACVSK